MKILMGGVPFGCDNVGDEAILECAVKIFREVAPNAEITVSTRDACRTSRKLGVKVCELLGFSNEITPAAARKNISANDVFVWCGATGLSDYPEVAGNLLGMARETGKRTIVWGVGMNDELNPVHYRVQPGRRQRTLELLGRCVGGLVDFVAWQERAWERRARERIAEELNRVSLLVVRDPETLKQLRRCGVTGDIVVGADSALLQRPAKLEEVQLPPGVGDLLHGAEKRIGLCISSQRPVSREGELAHALDRIIEREDIAIVAIPMNPLTDSSQMARLAALMERRDRLTLLTGRYEPEEIYAVASRMDVIVSSRLHLLIFGTSAGVPPVGIARGSKVSHHLGAFGIKPVGSVDECDFDKLEEEVSCRLQEKSSFQERSKEVNASLLRRLENAKSRLSETLQGC